MGITQKSNVFSILFYWFFSNLLCVLSNVNILWSQYSFFFKLSHLINYLHILFMYVEQFYMHGDKYLTTLHVQYSELVVVISFKKKRQNVLCFVALSFSNPIFKHI